MTDLYLSYYEHTTGGEAESDEEWCSYTDTDVEWGLEQCFKTKDKAPWLREVEEVDFDPKVGDKVYVLYVRYNTGNTFGRLNGAWFIVGIYEHRGQAEKISDEIENNTYEGYKCWEGYFERFVSCDVKEMVVE